MHKKNKGKPPVKHLLSGNSHRQLVGRCRQRESRRSAVTPHRMWSAATSSRGVKPSAKNRGNVTPRTPCGSDTFTPTQTNTRTRARSLISVRADTEEEAGCAPWCGSSVKALTFSRHSTTSWRTFIPARCRIECPRCLTSTLPRLKFST